jgi:hypothetical protein
MHAARPLPSRASVSSRFFASAAAGLVIGVAVSSCSSSSASPVGLADACAVNSDCDAPLVCVFAKCHEACAETRDCPTGERCVASGKYDVCTLPGEETCGGGDASTTCPGALVCGADDQCRNGCTTSDQCIPGQACTASTCVEVPDTPTGVPSDGGSSDGDATTQGPGSDGSSSTPDAPFVPDQDAGPLGFFPTNFSPSQADAGAWETVEGGVAGTEVAANCANTCVGTGATIGQTDVDGTLADVYLLDSLTIDATATLTLTGPRPIILAVRGAVDIQGLVLVAASASAAGPGGFTSPSDPGPGVGAPGNFAGYPGSLGGGGSYCGVGGAGGNPSGPGAPGGGPYGNAVLHPLVGGSAGGDWSSYGDSLGGGGGGALEIVSGTSISIGATGAVNAGGGGMYASGGSGGAILLEAPTVTIHGTVAANGGGGGIFTAQGANATASAQPAPGYAGAGGNGSAAGTVNGSSGIVPDAGYAGGGGGGAGRIRINTSNGSADVTGGTLSPGLDTPCATQGTIAR